jgi:hypothetical protein
MDTTAGIRRAYTAARDTRQAAREFWQSVVQPDMVLVLFFCSTDYDLNILATEFQELSSGIRLIGCTTAGEIGPGGYQELGIAGVSFSAEACQVVGGSLDHLQGFQISEAHTLGKELWQELQNDAPLANEQNTFALLLIDGLSLREEPIARILQETLGKIPLVGGSAGDGLAFRKTKVYFDGSFASDRAVLTLITTPFPFTVFKTQHFTSTDQRLVITEADTAHRVVKEINGLPAAQEYARLLGVAEWELTPARFAASPVVVLIDGNNYVRSIQRVNSDGSVTFYCAIDEGVVLRVAQGINLIDNLAGAFDKIRAQIGPPQLVIACDCILRRLEILQNGFQDRVGQLMCANNAVGFNTYGEQFRGVHVNQTITGIAIGGAVKEASSV